MIKNLLEVEKSKTKEFWLSNLVILISTVLAVYLAARAGLATAVEFEMVRSDRSSYYLQSSLLDEFKDNTDLALKLSEDSMDKEPDKKGKRKVFQYLGKNKHEIDTYVWTAMLESSETFEIKSQILTGIRRYNKLAKRVIDSVSKAEYGKSWNYRYTSQIISLLKETKKAKSKLIPMMQEEILILKKRLDSYGVHL